MKPDAGGRADVVRGATIAEDHPRPVESNSGRMWGCCSLAGLDLPQETLDANELRQIVMHDFDRDLAVVAHVVGEYTSAIPPVPILRSTV